MTKCVSFLISVGQSIAREHSKHYNLPMKLVDEDEYGAYRGVNAEFLKKFVSKTSNPNFDVYDSQDSRRRFIAVKSSRLPDDQGLVERRYGIDFNRAKPELQEALRYSAELPHALENMTWLANTAFAAATSQEYRLKSSAWDEFYSYIWGAKAKTIWVTPHSGSVNRPPDDVFAYPKTACDAFTAGVAAACAFNDESGASERNMIAVHSSSYLGTVVELGGFGIVNEERLAAVATKIETEYHDKAQILAGAHKRYFCLTATRWLEHIKNKKGTLDPEELRHTSSVDRRRLELIIKGLELYGQERDEFTLEGFSEAMGALSKMDVPVISTDYIYPARHVGRLLKVSEKIDQGLLHSALSIECSKPYLAEAPELMTSIILDVRRELFD